MSRTLDDLLAIASDVGFSEPGVIRRIARQAWELVPTGDMVLDDVPTTHLGGRPHLPPAIAWPAHRGKSLSFIGQIRLSDAADALNGQGFPRAGLLLFFYDSTQSTFGLASNDADAIAVIHVADADVPDVARDFPDDLDPAGLFPPCSLHSGQAFTIPDGRSVIVESLRLSPNAREAYDQLLLRSIGAESGEDRALVGGHPDQVQEDMSLTCAMVAAGLEPSVAAYSDPRMPDIRRAALDWRLLFQVPSTEAAGMQWGDVGLLYYWIRDGDLRAGRCDRVWFNLQW